MARFGEKPRQLCAPGLTWQPHALGGGSGGSRPMSTMTPGKIPVRYSITQKRAARGFKKEKLPRFRKIPSREVALFALLL
jgi:hypothetical protein